MSDTKMPFLNFVQTPHVIIDYWMSRLKDIEFKVLMAIARKTYGWQKERDKISISQLKELTGSTRTNVVASVESLIEKGLVRKDVEGSLGSQETYYQLLLSEDSNKFYQSQIETTPSPKLGPPPSPKLGLTKEILLNKPINKESSPTSSSPKPPDPEEKIDSFAMSQKEEEDPYRRLDCMDDIEKAYEDLIQENTKSILREISDFDFKDIKEKSIEGWLRKGYDRKTIIEDIRRCKGYKMNNPIGYITMSLERSDIISKGRQYVWDMKNDFDLIHIWIGKTSFKNRISGETYSFNLPRQTLKAILKPHMDKLVDPKRKDPQFMPREYAAPGAFI